jgi:predicted Zn-dependent peptidase
MIIAKRVVTMKSEIIRKTLSNGLRVIHIKNKMNNVNVTVSVKVGSENETPENNGVSHFLEHMLWHGTPNLTEEKIRTELKDKKANYNANTSFKKTSYYIGSPKRHFERSVQILAEIIQNPDFDEKKIETEKNIILDEYKHHKDNPNYFISELLVNKLFKDHPISKPIIGTQENIEHMNKEMLLKHYSDYYVPNNMVITVVGNLKEPEQFIEKYFTFQPKQVPVLNLVEPILMNKK